MEAKKGNGVFILVVSLIVLVGGGVAFFLYRKAKKTEQVKDEVTDEGIKTDEVITKDDDNSSSDDSSSGITENPFKTKDDLVKFQKWVINTKKDKTILGKGGASGFGDDGAWGKNSANAWDKYRKTYTEQTNVVVKKPTTKPKEDTKPQKVDEDAKLKLGSDNSNVSAIKQIINQVAVWTGIKSKNGVNFPLKTDNKFTKDTDKVVAFFFPKYKSNGYVTRKDARMLWSYTAGLKNKTFPSALVGNKDESTYKAEYKRGKEKSKKKFASFGEFEESKDNFSEFSDDQENFS